MTLDIPAGQRVLLAGPSGAGKSTLLRAMAGLLLTAAHGDLAGTVTVDGRMVNAGSGRVCILQQDPAASVVAETVGRDVAFGLENQRVPREAIWSRVLATLAATGFPYGVDHPTAALSGGETQRLALAGCLALGADVLLLDEPTSMLDPTAAAVVRRAIRCEVESRGATTVVVGHHLEPWLEFADRLLVMDRDGRLVADGPPAEVLATQRDLLARQGVWVPGVPAPLPTAFPPELVTPWDTAGADVVTARRVGVDLGTAFGGRRTRTTALHDVSARMFAGRVLAVQGVSGAGKSTLVSVLAGLLRPTRGTVTAGQQLRTRRGGEPWRWGSRDLAARLSWVPQTPEHGVVTRTAYDEVLAAGRSCGRDGARLQARVAGLLAALGLGPLAQASPFHLSGGEQRRLMVAAALAHGPAGVLFDEPTVGQDRATWAAVTGAITGARDAGTAVAVASHDDVAVSVVADAVLTLADGRQVAG